jgi:hypothetical protein
MRHRILGVGAVLASLLLPAGVAAHSPDPLLGYTPWRQDQVVGYQWASGQVPPGWMASAINAGATDVLDSRDSRAAVFARISGAPSLIAYGGEYPCPAYGIACMDRSGVPKSFLMWFRPYGTAYDWGTLRWCQGQSSPTNGCYDAENVALDELGHVEILGHHVNYSDDRDFTDAVVQTYARARPKAGWNQHDFGRCDVARLQLEYELKSPSDPVSSCLSLATTLGLSTSIAGSVVTFTGTLKIASSSAARRLSGDPLSRRAVTLWEQPVGSSVWLYRGQLAPSSTKAGAYVLSQTTSSTSYWRLAFTPSGEGLSGSQSSADLITTGRCSSATTLRGGSPANRGPGPLGACL